MHLAQAEDLLHDTRVILVAQSPTPPRFGAARPPLGTRGTVIGGSLDHDGDLCVIWDAPAYNDQDTPNALSPHVFVHYSAVEAEGFSSIDDVEAFLAS